MSKWDWTQPFSKPLDVQRKGVKTARSLLDNPGDQVIEHWPELKSTISGQVFPRMRGWKSDLAELRRPIRLGRLYAERRRTRRFARTIWLRPRGACLLLHISIRYTELICRRAFLKMLTLGADLLIWIRSLGDSEDQGNGPDLPAHDT